LIVWLNSLRIHCLTLQYMNYKYVFSCFATPISSTIILSCRERKT
jgi:hypothetical protein